MVLSSALCVPEPMFFSGPMRQESNGSLQGSIYGGPKKTSARGTHKMRVLSELSKTQKFLAIAPDQAGQSKNP